MPNGVFQHKKGHHLSEEHKKNLSIALRGRVPWNKGKNASREFRDKMREINLGEKNPRWNGGISICPRGYVYKLTKEHPYGDCDGYVAEHRLVMEKHIGRYLNPKEEIHHINRNKSDNRIDNLRLFKNRAEHMRFERTGTKLSIETRRKMSIAQQKRFNKAGQLNKE